ncbi:hypothetical protein BV20DRAFT_1053900 [Pilatotrama ljubarskyi]|nr:hypothetical protein BV20DRAFT_1053900 [Pilatotrama ljubarskyi]
MAEPHRSSNIASGSSSHKRSYDAIGPEADSDQTDVQHPTRSRRDSPPRPASGGEGSRERSKRARPDSNSSYASEVDHILLPTADSVSPSSSGSSHSSYHSAHSTLPGVASPPLLDVVDEDMLIDPVEPEPHATSPAGRIPSYIDTILSVSPRHSPAPSNPSRAPQRTSSEPFEENFARFLERATAFDREIAQLRSSPANLPTSSSRSANPLPPVYPPPELEDDFVIPDVYADIMPEVPSDHEDADEFQAFLRAPYTNPPSGRARVHGLSSCNLTD